MSEEFKECPFCAEDVKIEAKKCRHCGETLDVVLRVAEEAKNSQSNVFMNSGGGGGAAANNSGGEQQQQQLRPFPHWIHLVITLVTCGWWLIGWPICYLCRNKNYYF